MADRNSFRSYTLEFVVAQFIARQIPTTSRSSIWLNSPNTTARYNGYSINHSTTNLRIYCSCPVHRALATVSSSDKSLNYNALNVQLRKSYHYQNVQERRIFKTKTQDSIG